MRWVRQRCSAAGPAFVPPRERGVPVPPDSLSSHSFLPQSEGPGGPGTLAFIAQRVVSWGVLRRFAHSSFWRGQPGPRAVVLAPGAPTAYRALGSASLSHPWATRPCHWPGAGGGCAIGVAVRFRGRSDRVWPPPTHWGRSGRWHLWSGGDVIATPQLLSRTPPSALCQVPPLC